jgi:GNAT superfamily N-acetyltransferase
MAVTVEEIGEDRLEEYATIPIAFEVRSALHVELVDGGLGGVALREEAVAEPYVKDYEAYEDSGGPERWAERFDVGNWAFFLATEGERPVGGATVAFDTPGVHMLAGRRDLAVLWDLRVHPDVRRRGIGTALFRRAADWSRARGCTQLKIETQNVNVPACRFYARQGCRLGAIDRYGYAGHPQVGHETMLLWYLDL